MDFTITAIFYGMLGLGVATAVMLNATGSRNERWFQTIAAFFFWPIFIPLLLRPAAPLSPESDVEKADASATERHPHAS